MSTSPAMTPADFVAHLLMLGFTGDGVHPRLYDAPDRYIGRVLWVCVDREETRFYRPGNMELIGDSPLEVCLNLKDRWEVVGMEYKDFLPLVTQEVTL